MDLWLKQVLWHQDKIRDKNYINVVLFLCYEYDTKLSFVYWITIFPSNSYFHLILWELQLYWAIQPKCQMDRYIYSMKKVKSKAPEIHRFQFSIYVDPFLFSESCWMISMNFFFLLLFKLRSSLKIVCGFQKFIVASNF